MSDEMEGYRQQPGKLPFAKPGSGGSKQFSELRDMNMIPQSEAVRSLNLEALMAMMS